jgi:phospholipid/cholesterol/gamma-HCH transport system ATP-binding protein
MSADPIVITVENLSMAFGREKVLDGVDVRIRRGEIFLIVGGSGCGKSTLLKNMIGLYRPTAGRVLIEGVDIFADGGAALPRIRRTTGVLFQSGALIGSMTLAENVGLPLREQWLFPAPLVDRIVRMKLAMVNLSGYGNHLPAELSGGMKKRAGLARAMILDPAILFLDEPSSGLDPVTAAELDQTILAINRALGTTMVIVSHDLASIFSVAQRVIVLDKDARGIIAEGNPRQLKAESRDPRIISFFNRFAPEPAGR